MTRVYSPWDVPKAFLHNNTGYVLEPLTETELPDAAAAHVWRKLGATGVVALLGVQPDEVVRAEADRKHGAYLRAYAEKIANPPQAQEPGGPTGQHPHVVSIAAAIERHNQRKNQNEGPEAA
jgi:hypothetical protein